MNGEHGLLETHGQVTGGPEPVTSLCLKYTSSGWPFSKYIYLFSQQRHFLGGQEPVSVVDSISSLLGPTSVNGGVTVFAPHRRMLERALAQKAERVLLLKPYSYDFIFPFFEIQDTQDAPRKAECHSGNQKRPSVVSMETGELSIRGGHSEASKMHPCGGS